MGKRGRRKLQPGEVQAAVRGYGPLLRRDYWAVIDNCRFSPAQVMETVRRHFPAFAPPELVVFEREGAPQRPLEKGDELGVRIVGVGRFRARVLSVEAQSITLGTIAGHPEAGRITFGAYRNAHGDVLFHIRSHARSRGPLNRLGFRATGEVMQTSAWTEFIDRVAAAFGDSPMGYIHAETSLLADEPDEAAASMPTFLARGG